MKNAFKLIGLCLVIFFSVSALTAPQLASVYDGEDVSDFLVSEKYDGIRAIWDGKTLKTRNGNVIHAPTRFIAPLPKNMVLDGELWSGYGQFEFVAATVLDKTPDMNRWQAIQYRVFDIPSVKGDFKTRWLAYRAVIESMSAEHVVAIEQRSLESNDKLYDWLDGVIKRGGEGLMLHRRDARHMSGRTDNLLKLKPFMDAEAKVIEYLPGKGRLQGIMGALLVELENGIQFKIGTGFSDTDRRDPPPIGTIITFRYQGLTKRGVPRFASFQRVRTDDFEFREKRR